MPKNSVVRLTDHPDMTLAVDWDVKQQNNNNLAPYQGQGHQSTGSKEDFEGVYHVYNLPRGFEAMLETAEK
ncbi:MAG: hypothetical protein AB2693_19465 [Candidatus Thiodiazotropha sp.]